MPYPNHLGSQRKRWKLSTAELAHLLGDRHKSVVSRTEAVGRPPTPEFALACQVVFGTTPADLFSAFYTHIEEAVMRRALRLDEKLAEDPSEDAAVKRALLRDMVRRSPHQP